MRPPRHTPVQPLSLNLISRRSARTETIDFGIVLSGEIVLLVDEGEMPVRPGEIVVQGGTNQGSANRTDQPCRIAFVLIDGVFADGLE